MLVSKLLPIDPNGKQFSFVCTSSGYLSASQQVVTGQAILAHVEVITNGSSDATAIIYDGTDTGGTALFHAFSAGADVIAGGVKLNIMAETGLYLSLAGAGAKAIVSYIQ